MLRSALGVRALDGESDDVDEDSGVSGHDVAPLTRRAMLLGATAAAAVFAATAAVASRSPRSLDERVVSWIAERRSPWSTDLSDLMATLGSADVMTPVSIVVVVVLLAFRRFRGALLLGLAMSVESVLNPALKSLFGLPRPSGDLAVYQYAEAGFPSGHAMAAATFCASLALIAWPTRWRYAALVAASAWALSMGLSRVCLGVHWPTDVIGGWAAGVALACGLGAAIGVAPAGKRAAGDADARSERGATAAGRSSEPKASVAEPAGTTGVRVVLFDWGNTLMVDDGQPGSMASWPRVAAVAGATEALAALHGRYRLCVATNADDSGAGEVMAALGRVGLARFIDRVFSSCDLGARKPDPSFYAAVIAALRADATARGERPLRADEIVMVGDSYENDVTGASAAGLRAVWYNPRTTTRPPDADPRLAQLADLRRLVELLQPAAGPDREEHGDR